VQEGSLRLREAGRGKKIRKVDGGKIGELKGGEGKGRRKGGEGRGREGPQIISHTRQVRFSRNM